MEANTLEKAAKDLKSWMGEMPLSLAKPRIRSFWRVELAGISAVQSVRLPVLRASGEIEQLPEGYDAESRVLTLSQPGMHEAFLEAVQRGAELDALWIEGSEFFGEAGEQVNAGLAAVVGGEHAGDGIHLRLPMWIRGRAVVNEFCREDGRLVQVAGNGEVFQSGVDEFRVGHAANEASPRATSKA